MSGRPKSADDELRFALAGPAVTALIAAIFGALAAVLPRSAPAALRALVGYQLEINLLILGFNLIPAFPLDGGRVARALLWHRRGDIRTATNTAAGLGRGFGYLLIALGLLLTLDGAPAGLWFALIGVFLAIAANAERLQEEVSTAFTGVPAAVLMSHPAVSIPSEITLDQAEQYFARYRYTAFPVTDETGRAIGLLSISQLERTVPWKRGTLVVRDQADRDPALLISEQEDVAHLLEQSAFARVGRAAVLDDQRRPIGLVSITDIQRSIRTAGLRKSTSDPASLVPH